MEWLLAVRVLLGLGMAGSLWMIISGLIDMQRINTQDENVLELVGTIRRLDADGRRVQLNIKVEDEVLYVNCLLPGKRHAVTDLVPVMWRKGSMEAVAAATITQSYMQMICMPLGGLSGGTQPLLSFNFGARKVDRIKQGEKVIVATGFIITAAMFLVLPSSVGVDSSRRSV